MMQDLNDLRFFAAVVAQGGFSAAARSLQVPKSRISRRVAALEARLGLRLLERSSRRLRVTQVGEEVYRHASAAVAEAEAVELAALRLRAEPQGLVRVSCPINAGEALAEGLPGLLKRYERLRVQLIMTNRRVDLIEEGVDVAIRVRQRLDTDPDLIVRQLGRTKSVLVASPDFLDRSGRPADVAALRRLPTLDGGEARGRHRWSLSDGAGREVVLEHEPRLASGDFAILRQAAIDGLGVALLPEAIAQRGLDEGRLERVLPDWTSRGELLHLVFTSQRGLLPGVRAVIDCLAEALAGLSTEPG